MTIRLRRADRTAQVRVALEGYTHASTEISARADAQVQLALVKESAPPRRAPPVVHPKKPAPAPAKRPAKPLGDLADPFAP